MNAHALVPALAVPLIAWRMYARVRRNIGRQSLRPRRMITGLVIFSVFSLLLVAFMWRHLPVLAGFGAGLVLGVPLGWLGLRLTRFDTTEQGHFYTPNTYVGAAISFLLIGRIAYRFAQVAGGAGPAGGPSGGMPSSPLTFALFGVVAGYYMTYYAGVLIKGREHVAKTASRSSNGSQTGGSIS